MNLQDMMLRTKSDFLGRITNTFSLKPYSLPVLMVMRNQRSISFLVNEKQLRIVLAAS
jgi:hypothetical protein